MHIEETGLRLIAERYEKATKAFMQGLADLTLDEMRKRTPVKTARLVGSISAYVSPLGLEARVGPNVSYAVFVERGTRPHIITPVRAQALRFMVGGEVVFAKMVRHPGTKPQYFMRGTAEFVERKIPELWEKSWGK